MFDGELFNTCEEDFFQNVSISFRLRWWGKQKNKIIWNAQTRNVITQQSVILIKTRVHLLHKRLKGISINCNGPTSIDLIFPQKLEFLEIQYKSQDIVLQLYEMLVRPHVGSYVQFWSPCSKKDIIKLGRVCKERLNSLGF